MYCSASLRQTYISCARARALEFKLSAVFNSPHLAFYRLCMCPGQSAFVFLVVLLLICLVAMSDDDFLVGVPASESSSDSDFVMGRVAPRRPVAGVPAPPAIGGDGPDDASSSDNGGFMIAGAVPVRRTRQRARTMAQTAGAFLAVATAGDSGAAAGAGQQDAVALVRMSWALKEPDYVANDRLDVGIIEYIVEQCLPFERDVPLPCDLGTSALSAQRAALLCEETLVTMPGGTNKKFGEVLKEEELHCEALVAFSERQIDMINGADDAAPFRIRAMRIASRGRFPPIIGRSPDHKNLQRWRVEVRDKYREVSENPPPGGPGAHGIGDVDELLHLPPGRERYSGRDHPAPTRTVRRRGETDPIRIVRCINVVQHLRQPALFQEVLEGCVDYLGMEEANASITHNYSLDPSRRPMDRALARADVVSMNLQRRLFKHWRREDSTRSINIYSDASPVVGAELQGMVIDVNFKDDTMTRIVLPGSTLAYGFAGTMSKSVALVHALWLIAGPSAEDIRWVCTKVLSLTTDFGVEMHLLEAPDMIDAYLAHMNGSPFDRLRPLVKHDVRLFLRALRVAGWSHTIGGIMKRAAEAFPDWPQYLTHERYLCKFYKNVTYRKHIVRSVGGIFPNLKEDLKSFTAGFAKWRYETEVVVLRQLLKLRRCSESQINPVLFNNAQDQAEILGVFRACKDIRFWKWASASSREVFERLEKLRTWGMVCNHCRCEELRRESGYRKKVPCDRITVTQ